ncbi:hypothetical protein AWN88_00255 [Agrobacterium tumefaciens]|nr:hypothetical protein AWN88_00255 [Agrobacterium tumefaciens]KAJ32571.1 hypothetical protein BW45_19525 [Agrobacterium tumefaciens]
MGCLAFQAVSVLSPGLAQDNSAGPNIKLADIRITAGDKVIMGELIDTPMSRDFLAQLPATWPMSRLRERE